ncbi:putative transcription factor bHLH041 [Typha latifolia]|uniref:putative transcription factor bHLH041 n=1 Tax=Typha latifolia TaxID=4733 RepID=UPI003C2AEB29
MRKNDQQFQHQITMQAYGRTRNIRFPTPESDDAAMARAMLDVISSTPSSPLLSQYRQQEKAQSSGKYRLLRAFKSYNSALAPNFQPRGGVHSQKMFKMAILMLRRVHKMTTRFGDRTQELTASNQLHHVLAERKRRKKLNESFDALRMLLPQGSKTDKASVLTKAKEYLGALKAQISELEEKNRMLEMQLYPSGEVKDVGDSSRRVEVHITSVFDSISESMQINLRVILRVECEMAGVLVHILECLRQFGCFSLMSIDASSIVGQTSMFARARLTLQVKTRDWDEESFKEAMAKVVKDAAVAALEEAGNPGLPPGWD